MCRSQRMAKQFDPRKVLRLTSNALLQDMFAREGELLEVPWSTLKETQVQPVYEAMQGLTPARITQIETLLRDVQELADERGVIALAEELGACSPGNLPVFAALESRHDKAMWTHLHEPLAFHRAAIFARADALSTGRHWAQRNGLPHVEIKVDDAMRNALASSMSAYYLKAQARGGRVVVEPYERSDGSIYLFGYIEDYPDTRLAFDDASGMVRVADRGAFENVFVYNRNAGTLDVFAYGGKKVREPLQECFSTVVLGQPLPPEDRRKPPYRLDHLLDPATPFPTDPADGVARVRVRRLRIEPLDRPRRRITLDADPEGSPSDIHHMIDEYLRAEAVPRSKLRVTHAAFSLEFVPGPATQPRSMSFEVSSPDSCNLKSKPESMRLLGERCLRLWGISGG